MSGQRFAHRTAAEVGVLGDGDETIRIPNTDLVVFRLGTSTGRLQIGHLPRVLTGEVTYLNGVYSVPLYAPEDALTEGAIVFVERLSGRAPCGWRVVADGLI